MSLLEKLYSFMIFGSVIIGIFIGQFDQIQPHMEYIIIPLLFTMLYISFLQIPLEDLKLAFKNKKFTLTAVLINFVWTPLLALLLASTFLSDYPALWIGFIMLMVTPCTDWYLVFTGIAKGNLAISTVILPLNFILQILLLPVYLYFFAGSTGLLQYHFLLESVVIILLVPFVLAIVTNYLLKRKEKLKELFFEKLTVLPIIFLSLAIVAMFASQGQLLLENLDLLWKIFIPVILFFTINFFVSIFVSKKLHFSYADRASLSLTTLARNSPIALAIAITAFPDQPLIALTLIIGPLLELPILAIISQLLLSIRRKSTQASE